MKRAYEVPELEVVDVKAEEVILESPGANISGDKVWGDGDWTKPR